MSEERVTIEREGVTKTVWAHNAVLYQEKGWKIVTPVPVTANSAPAEVTLSPADPAKPATMDNMKVDVAGAKPPRIVRSSRKGR